ncbi:MAG: B12-binding domain-containing radical SAM protein [Candidatus Aminicenantes bacterium]|nr:B12-binding domain-containing radical SAM protein [Candidatus Aminicenantes bacterium]
MLVFLIYVRDDNYYHPLPVELGGKPTKDGRVKVMAFPPLGIQTLAPAVRQHGHQALLFDTCHPGMKTEHIAKAIEAEHPDVIALSFLSTTTYPAVKKMARRLKSVSPLTPVITGGPFATINALNILKECSAIDAVGVGEGEELLPDYLDHLNDPGSVAGLVWRKGAEIVKNPPRPLIQDLDQFPYPDRLSLPIDYVESLPLDVPAVLSLDRFCTMQTSRGCPYNCIYCDIPYVMQHRWRSRSPQHVLGEMQQLNDLGYRSIYLTDDHFIMKRKRIMEICNGIIDRKLEFHWGCEGRVDSLAVDQMRLMARAHCQFLAFGIESGTQKTLDRLNKRQSLKQIEHAVTEAKRQGITRVHGFFLIGSPGESEKDILESFRFAARLQLDTFGFNRLCAYRGTPLWREYVDQGIIDDDLDWHKWFKCSDIDSTVLPSKVVNHARMKGYGLLFILRIFLRPVKTFRLIRTFGRYMKKSDIFKLLSSPFKRRTLTHKPDLPNKMTEAGLSEPERRGNNAG